MRLGDRLARALSLAPLGTATKGGTQEPLGQAIFQAYAVKILEEAFEGKTTRKR